MAAPGVGRTDGPERIPMRYDGCMTGTLTLTEDHLNLLDRIYIGYDDCAFGAPCVDPKRPYGNSNVYSDIGEILGVQPEDECDGEPEFSDAQRDRFYHLHREMQHVLQILCQDRVTHPGTYLRTGMKWTLVDWSK